MDKFKFTTKLLQLINEDETKLIGEDLTHSLIDDYYFARDNIEKALSIAFPEFSIAAPITVEKYELYKKAIMASTEEVARYFNKDIEFSKNAEINFDDVINIDFINEMYSPSKYGHGFSAEVVIPIVLTALQTAAGIAGILIPIIQHTTSNGQKTLGKDNSVFLEELLTLLKSSDLNDAQKERILSQIDFLLGM